MNNYLRLIDTNTTGPRYDVTPLFSDYEAFAALVKDLAYPFADAACDYVAGIDALGFILDAAVQLIKTLGCVVISVAAINIDDNAATGWLREAHRCHTVWLDDE